MPEQPPPPKTQRAQILQSFNTPYTFTTTHPTPPAPTGHELLIRVLAASYCHTDHVFASGAMQQELPRIGCHEFAGVVHSFGSAYNDDDDDSDGGLKAQLGLRAGMLVGVPGRAKGPCGDCEECALGEAAGDPKGYGVWCARAGNLGLSVHGGWQEWCLVDGRQVAPVPTLRGEVGKGEPVAAAMEAVDVAPLMCAGVTVWSAIMKAGVDMSGTEEGRRRNAGRTVAIVGAGGGLGHLGVQFASLLGTNVVAADVGGALKLAGEVARECEGKGGGKVVVVDASKNVADTKRELFGEAETGREGEKGCHAAIVLPEAQAAFDFGMGILRSHSTCVVVSFPKDGWRFQPRDTVFRHIDIVGVLTGRNKDLRAMLRFAAENGVRAKLRTYKLEDLNELVKEYEGGDVGGKLVVDMTK